MSASAPSDTAPRAVRGRAFPPGRSHETRARLEADGDAVLLIDEADGSVLRRLGRGEAVPDAPLGRLERRVALPDGAVFLTDDAAGLDAVLGRGRGDGLHRLERLHPRLVLVTLAAVAAAVLIWRLAMPALVAVAVWATPPAMKGQMDRGTMAAMGRLGGPTALPPARQDASRAVFADLVAAAGPMPPGVVPALVFQDSRLGANAFALPGGTVVATDDLVVALGDDLDALAGVLAHELTHVQEQHGLRGLYRALGLYVVIGLVAGDTGPILDEVLLEGNALLSLAGSRAFERAADAGALRLTEAAGYDPAGLERFFETMLERHGDGGGWLSTHPGTAERRDAVRDALGR